VLSDSNRLNGLLGLLVNLQPALNVITESSTSLFDVLQTVWGLGTVCFTVLLLKVTKYINVHQKQMAVTPVCAEHRENLGIMLSKVSQLLKGRHRR
jgi:hypothetical protein